MTRNYTTYKHPVTRVEWETANSLAVYIRNRFAGTLAVESVEDGNNIINALLSWATIATVQDAKGGATHINIMPGLHTKYLVEVPVQMHKPIAPVTTEELTLKEEAV